MRCPPAGATNLTWNEAGFWVTEAAQAISYPDDGNEICYSLEDDSFWFRHRNRVLATVMHNYPPGGDVFDVGGGNGYVAAGMERAGFPTVLVEPGMSGARNAVRRGLQHVVCGTTDDAGFAPATLPAIGLFDVLEHIADDAQFLAKLGRLLMPGGRIYLTVPAFQMLWSDDDQFAGHYQRYTTKSLADTLAKADFDVEYRSYFFSFLPPPVFLLRTIPSWLGIRANTTSTTAKQEHAKRGGFVGRLLERIMEWERNRLANGWTMPIGGSCLAVARWRG